MFTAPASQHLVPFDQSLLLGSTPTAPPEVAASTGKKALAVEVKRISKAQEVLYAHDRYAVLLVFQAMDAAGKDGTIRAVTKGVNPAGRHVVSFKAPSTVELDHDFLWRSSRALPERGRIGVFNRSYYEEVLVVRVHPGILEKQNLPDEHQHDNIWLHRYQSIRDHELHLARNGVVVLKFFLHVSQQEQRRRFLSRLEDPDKYWKFSPRDLAESEHWTQYMESYQDALNATSRPWVPWYVIPADDKRYMRYRVANIVADAMDSLGFDYPKPDQETLKAFEAAREALASRGRDK
jgi:PPK2 family polyphosphate:nucleotide phosphotransferase